MTHVPDDVWGVTQFEQEHDFTERTLRGGRLESAESNAVLSYKLTRPNTLLTSLPILQGTHLGISDVLERGEDLLERHCLAIGLLHSLPYHPICLHAPALELSISSPRPRGAMGHVLV